MGKMKKDRKNKKYFAAGIVGALMIFLLYAMYLFVNGFFGGLLLYVLLLPAYSYLIKKGRSKKFSAGLMVFLAFILIITPLLLVLGVIGREAAIILQDEQTISTIIDFVSDFTTKMSPNLTENFLENQISKVGQYATSLFFGVISNVGKFIINLLIALFLLYFMLIYSPLFEKIEKFIPFSKKNSKRFIKKLEDVSYGTIFVGGLLSLLQGALVTISFLIFGINGAFLFGFIGAIVSFLPVLGPSLVWVPAAAIQLIQGEYFTFVGLLIFGIFLSNVDNLLRPYLGDKIARIHPLVTLIGIFVGIPVFGIIGVFLGPLILAFLILALEVFKNEYLD